MVLPHRHGRRPIRGPATTQLPESVPPPCSPVRAQGQRRYLRRAPLPEPLLRVPLTGRHCPQPALPPPRSARPGSPSSEQAGHQHRDEGQRSRHQGRSSDSQGRSVRSPEPLRPCTLGSRATEEAASNPQAGRPQPANLSPRTAEGVYTFEASKNVCLLTQSERRYIPGRRKQADRRRVVRRIIVTVDKTLNIAENIA